MKTVALLAVVSLGIAAAGCSHTLSGASQDVSHDTQTVTSVAQNAGTDVKQAANNAGADVDQAAANAKAATVLKPAIKLAFFRDPILDDKRNYIAVHVDAKTVTLTGHVISADMITRATEDAQKVLSDHRASQTIANTLSVSTP